ncbi:MAG: antibiotic biosynthesis monooxygenase [Sphingorhabdus sp.]
MATLPSGSIAVIFVAQRTNADGESYAKAASAMVALASRQEGYLGIDSVRESGGLGITVSYWASDEAARAWRDHPEHVEIRNEGRGRWYQSYSLHVAAIERSYDWQKP